MKNKILVCLLDILMFISLLFIGSDTLSFRYKDVTFRYVQFVLPMCFVLLNCLRAYNMKHFKTFLPFIIVFFLSTIFAINFWDGAAYFIWLIYNIFFITYVIASYIKLRGKDKFLNMLRSTFFITVILLVVQFFLLQRFDLKIPYLNHQKYKGIYRPCLWFYEPSYVVTMFSFPLAYFTYRLIVGKQIKYLPDVVFLCIGILLTTSSTGYVAIILSFVGACVFIMFDKKIKVRSKLIMAISAISAIVICLGVMYLCAPEVFDIFFMRLIKENIDVSSTGRTSKYIQLWEAFKNYPILGVGPNNYHNYWGEGRYFQPTNTTLEFLATTGILGLFTFVYLLCGLIFKSKNNTETMAGKFGIICFMIIMQANQNFMRLYLWGYIGMILGYAFIYPQKKRTKCIYINGLFLTQSLTGIQRLCYEFVDRLEPKYKNIKFVILAPKKQDIDAKNIKIEIKRIGLFKGLLWEQISLPIYMLTKHNSTLWNLGNDAPMLYPGTTMIHDVIFYEKDYKKGLWALKCRIITNLNANRYDKIICPSYTTKNRIHSLFPSIKENEIVVCNPGYDHVLNFGEDEFELPVQDYHLSVSSVLKNKNFDYIINLAKIRKNENFVVIGKKEKIEEMFEEIPINVYFTGYVPDSALKKLYCNCKAFISPSLYEGFGVPPIEAMAFGCKRIYISDILVYKEIYSDSVMYFDPLNVDDLNVKLNEKYVVSEEKRKILLDKYKWDNFTSNFVKFNVD